MTKILSGKIIRDRIASRLKGEIGSFKSIPTLTIIQIGKLSESNAYINQKKLFAERIGAKVRHFSLPVNVKEKEILSIIKKLNADRKVNGIIVQLPIPTQLNKNKIIESMNPLKDVDGMHSENVQKLFAAQNDGYIPATARGVKDLLKSHKVPLVGRKVLVIGRSILVGKPIAITLLNENATVTIAHSHSKNLRELTKAAEILIVAAGVPKLIGPKHVNKGQVIVDVGINMVRRSVKKLQEETPSSKMVGDVDFQAVEKKVKAISPVPGGVGPMTVASLFQNLIDAYKKQNLLR